MNKYSTLDLVLMVLLVVGGLNWGLVGLLDFNLVSALFGSGSLLSRLVYILVGISGLYYLISLFSRRNSTL